MSAVAESAVMTAVAKRSDAAAGEYQYSVMRVLRDRSLRHLYELFLIVQLLDVGSSAAGQLSDLHEANPLTLAIVQAWGTPGFLVSKIPVFLITLLALARLPRRMARFAAVILLAVSIPVVLWNIHLLLQASNFLYPELR